MADRLATAAEAKSLGFTADQAKLIKKVGNEFVFDKSLAPDREGFKSVYAAPLGGLQMTPYYGDVTGDYQLTGEQYAKAKLMGGNLSENILKIMSDNEMAAKDKRYNNFKETLAKENPGWTPENIDRAAKDMAYGNERNGGMTGFTGTGGGNMTTTAAGDVITTGGYNQTGTPVAGGQYDVNGNYVGINLTAGTSSTPTGTLAVDTFKATLGLIIGKDEMTKPWVTQLYKATSKFYKSGSTIDESFNLAIQDVQNNPDMAEFTKRFKGIYDLTDKRRKGEPVYVPTVAEYFATEKTMADALKSSNLGELANEDFLGGIIGKAVSASEFTGRIQNVFDKIDYAPAAVKKTMQQVMPYVDRASLAKALLTGEEGAKQLQAKVAGIEVLAAAQQQGLGATTLASATDLANQGYNYQQALSGYQQVASIIPTAQKLTAIEGTGAYTQQQAENVVFGKSAAEELALSQLGAREQARYRGSSGNLGSKSLASSNRGY
jgi:hypothetical protein